MIKTSVKIAGKTKISHIRRKILTLGFIFLCPNKQTYDFFSIPIYQDFFKAVVVGLGSVAHFGILGFMVAPREYQSQ